MKITYSILFFFLVLNATGQTWKSQFDEMVLFIEQQNFSQAYEKGLSLEKLFTPVKNKEDTLQADAYYYMAYSCYALQKYEEALKYALTERQVRTTLQGNEHPSLLNCQYMLAVYASYLAEYSTAITAMTAVMDYAEKNYGKKNINFIHYANQVANLYNAAGAYKKAEALYEDNYKAVKAGFQPTDSIYQVMVNTISAFYTGSGNYEKSEPFFLDAVSMQEQAYGKKSNNYMASFNSLGEFYIYAGMYDKAEKTYREFVRLSEDFYGKKSADYATSLNNLAVSLEKQDKNTDAEKIYLECLKIKESVYSKKSNFYALTLVNIGAVYDNLGEYNKAEKYLKEALQIYKEVNGGEGENYATALSNIANVYSSMGKTKEADEALREALQVYKRMAGENSPGYLTAYNNLAYTHVANGQYELAQKEFQEIIQLRSKIQGAEHTEVAVSIYNLANLETQLSHYKIAEELYLKALQIQKKALGENHSSYANILQSLAQLYFTTGRYQKAEKSFDECEKIYNRLYGNMHPEMAVFLNNKAQFYFELTQYNKSEELYENALEINFNAYGKDHPNNIALYSNFANLKTAKTEFKQAEELLLKANQIVKNQYGEKHPDYATTLNNLASLYAKLGNYDKAELYYQQSLAKRKDIYGEKHPEYGVSLNNLGALYLERANDATTDKEILDLSLKAIVLFQKSLVIDSINIGKENLDYASHLNNLAEAYRVRMEWEKAETYFNQSLTIEEKVLGKFNSKSAITLHNMAMLYSAQKKYDKAEQLALQSFEIFKTVYGPESIASASLTSSLANIYHRQGKTDEAEKHYKMALTIQQRALDQNFTFLSEEEKEKYIASVSVYNNMYNSFAYAIKDNKKPITISVYENEVRNKGALLRSSSRIKNIAANSTDESIKTTFSQWTDLKQQLAVLYSSNAEDKKAKLDSLEILANALEKELTEKSTDIKTLLEQRNVTYEDVKKQLGSQQAAIEFIRYTVVQDTSIHDLKMYCALVLKNNQSYPEMIKLCYEDDLQKILGENKVNNVDYISSIYTKNSQFYTLLWEPLQASLENITEIFYSPSGLLNKVSFAAIRDKENTYLSDKFLLHQVNSTAQIRSAEKLALKGNQIAVYGGVAYNTSSTKNTIWKYLPGTMTEAEKINTIALSAGMKPILMTGEKATESNFKTLDDNGSPIIIHIATHGFFFSDPEETKKQLVIETKEAVNFRGTSIGTKNLIENSNPLMRSGIVLAGANNIWNETSANGEDGVLTAYEAGLMNLNQTALAVLSACETGLGDIKGNEGVYGLQRAFKIAGAQKLMMSLWQVPDKETEEFMSTFYTQLTKLNQIEKAYAATQKIMRNKYEPYYWAAFVLIE